MRRSREDEEYREDVALESPISEQTEPESENGFNKPVAKLAIINNEGEVVDSIVIEQGDLTGISQLNLQVWLGSKVMELLSLAGVNIAV